MRWAFFYHSLLSDWNHGNAHFLRGVASELLARGHEVVVYEPYDAWSLQNLLADAGPQALQRFAQAYPQLHSVRYQPQSLDLDSALADVDMVLVHEWNHPDLVARIGTHRCCHQHYRLLFHDTHHRSVSDRTAIGRFDLQHYDGILAFGAVVRDIYLQEGWGRKAWVWHEAADTRVFYPRRDEPLAGEIVWIGNWGDDERTAELHQFLLQPVRRLGVRARFYGVRYPEHALQALRRLGITYGGWLANFEVPHVFGRYRVTVHVPRRPYVKMLPGIPTIRPFEAMASGIPLLSAPWEDCEHLFRAGHDYLVARNSRHMDDQLKRLLGDPQAARQLAANALQTIERRHTCGHRVDELLAICQELGVEADAGGAAVAPPPCQLAAKPRLGKRICK